MPVAYSLVIAYPTMHANPPWEILYVTDQNFIAMCHVLLVNPPVAESTGSLCADVKLNANKSRVRDYLRGWWRQRVDS
jgi:hypothetical protein